MKRLCIAALFLFAFTAQGQSNSIFGNWADPTGSIIQIYRCGQNACSRLVAISATAPTHVDAGNPNPALRARPLCGLQIGTNFHLASSDRAEGGRLYDPQSGKTYTGSMTRDGDKLRLRGYIGFSLFGRTEIWTRAPENIVPCRP